MGIILNGDFNRLPHEYIGSFPLCQVVKAPTTVVTLSKFNNNYCAGYDTVVYRRIVDNSSKALFAHALQNTNLIPPYQTFSCEDMVSYFYRNIHDIMNAVISERFCECLTSSNLVL